MKGYLLYLLLFIYFASSAQIKIFPDGHAGPTGPFPATWALEAKGGLHKYTDTTNANAVLNATARKDSGMIVYTTSDNKYWYWDGIKWGFLFTGGQVGSEASNGLVVGGNSIAASTGATTLRNGYAYILQNSIGGLFTNYSQPGNYAADMSWRFWMTNTNPIGGGFDPIYVNEIGTNDAIGYGSNVNKQNIFRRIVTNNIAWCAIPSGSKKMGQQFTLTGFTNDASLQLGLGVTSSTNGSSITTSINTKANTGIYIGYLIQDGATGTFTVSVDGVLQADPYSGSNTWTTAGDGGALIATGQNPSTTSAVAAVRIPVTASGTHTIIITNTSNGLVTIYWAGSAPLTTSTNNPYVVVVSPNHQNSANDAVSGDYATFLQGISTTANATDGLNVLYADTRTALGTNYAGYYVDAVHPNDAGHALMASVIKSVIPAALQKGAVKNSLYQFSRDYISTAPINPTYFSTPNGYNLNSSTGWNPGHLYYINNGNAGWVNYQSATGLTTAGPNTGASPIWSVASYTPSGKSPQSPPSITDAVLYVAGNKATLFNPTALSTTSTMLVQNNLVRVGPNPSTGIGNSFSTTFASNYLYPATAATSSLNQSSPLWYWSANIWDGSVATRADLGFFNKPLTNGGNPDYLLTLMKANGGTGRYGVDFNAATYTNLYGKGSFRDTLKYTNAPTANAADSLLSIASDGTIRKGAASRFGLLTSADLTNYVTTNTFQTVSGNKTFSSGITVNNGLLVGAGGMAVSNGTYQSSLSASGLTASRTNTFPNRDGRLATLPDITDSLNARVNPGGETLQSVTNRSNITTNEISVYDGLGGTVTLGPSGFINATGNISSNNSYVTNTVEAKLFSINGNGNTSGIRFGSPNHQIYQTSSDSLIFQSIAPSFTSPVVGKAAISYNQFVIRQQLTDSLSLRGSYFRNPVLVTNSTYTILGTEDIVWINCSTGTNTTTMPSASTYAQKRIVIKNINNANSINVSGMASGEINSIGPMGAFTAVSNGTAWYAISNLN